jgi:L-asparaginase
MPPIFRSFARASLAALMVLAARPVSAQSDSAQRPKVLVIATGGTIAGVQDKPGTLGDYRAGTLTAEQILASVPQLATFARVEAEQFTNVASGSITPALWMSLARRINEVLAARTDLAGVVVTHGTDRLEETAFFLYLAVRSAKPVIVVGAQRPATGISPDGPMNLLSAVRTAASPQSVDKGVMVVMDERILSAREARKGYRRVGGFSGGEMGMLGVVASGGAEFFFAPTRRHGPSTEFDVSQLSALPSVDMVITYQGGTGRTYDVVPAGIVIAGTSTTCEESAAYQRAAQRGAVIVNVFPSGDEVSNDRTPRDTSSRRPRDSCPAVDSLGLSRSQWIPSVSVQHLTPAKARILLMLALTRTRDPRAVQRFFDEY